MSTWDLSPDSFGVWLWGKSMPPGWECVAICDTAAGVKKHVTALQEYHRGRLKLKVDRLPRRGRPDATPCSYCGPAHWGKCQTDDQGNPTGGAEA